MKAYTYISVGQFPEPCMLRTSSTKKVKLVIALEIKRHKLGLYLEKEKS